MFRILLYIVLGYLAVKIVRDLLTPKSSQDKKGYGNSQPKKKIDFNEKDIEDAQFEDIDEQE